MRDPDSFKNSITEAESGHHVSCSDFTFTDHFHVSRSRFTFTFTVHVSSSPSGSSFAILFALDRPELQARPMPHPPYRT